MSISQSPVSTLSHQPVAAARSWPRLGRPRVVPFMIVVMTVAASAMHLAGTGGTLTSGYTIQRLQAEQKVWQVRNQQIELELARARSLGWIETEAVRRLGMQRAADQTALRVDAPPPPVVDTRPAPSTRGNGLVRTQTEDADDRIAPPSWFQSLSASAASFVVGQ